MMYTIYIVYIAILLIVFTVRFIARFQTSTTWVLRQPTISESHNLLCVQKTTRIRPPVAYKFYVRNDRGWSRGTGYGTARKTADTLDKSPVRTGLRFDSSWDSTVWTTWGRSLLWAYDGIFFIYYRLHFKIENIYLCVEQKRFGGHGVHWSSILMFPLGVGIPRFAHKPCGRQLSACGLWCVLYTRICSRAILPTWRGCGQRVSLRGRPSAGMPTAVPRAELFARQRLDERAPCSTTAALAQHQQRQDAIGGNIL